MDEQEALEDIVQTTMGLLCNETPVWFDVTDVYKDVEDHYEGVSKWRLLQHRSGLIVKVHVSEWTP